LTIKIIAEIGSNWEGDIELAKKHIKAAKNSGANFVKFQMWRAEDLYDTNHPQWESIKKSELTEDIAKELKKNADEVGIGWFCSVFNPDAVEFLEELNVSHYKIASRTSTMNDKFALETIQKVADTKKNTFVSTGEGGNRNEIAKYFSPENLAFTYCVSKYPTEDNEIDWGEIFKYNFFSDHTRGITIPLIYAIEKQVSRKKDVFIEKHTRFEDSKGPDSIFATTYEELKQLHDHISRIENMDFIKRKV
jgi:N,N'-diacetyllegionaminate synthase